MTQPGWDDERLEAAFHQRFDRPAPPDLEKVLGVRMAGTTPARFIASRRAGVGWALAAAAVIVIMVGTLTVGLGGLGLTAGSPSPSASVANSTPGASATPTEQALPGSVFGLPIIHLPDAIAIRDSGVDDREFAVQGWFTPAPPVSCGGDAAKTYDNPVMPHCPDELIWLTEDAGSYVHVTGNRLDTETPQFTAALNPDLDGLDRSWFPDLPVPGTDGGSTPSDVVFVGHFDDRRAMRCFGALQACRDRFVVDSVAMVHGVPTNVVPVYQNTAKASSSPADIEALIGNEAPGSPILSMTVVDGADGLVTFEPSLSDGQEGLIHQRTAWIVRVLESERISTYIVVDGSDAIYEMNPIGEAILVGGTPPAAQSTASPSAWPPTGATVVDLSNGIGKPPVHVAVVDMSGRLISVVVPSDTNVVSGVDGFGALGEPGKPGRVNLSWVGGICDSQVTATVAADLRSISFDMGPRPDCDSIGVGHQLVLDFAGSVDVASIQVGEGIAAPPAGPTQGLDYTLDCGPLAPDRCQTEAARIVTLTREADPSRRIVALSLTDDCGSYLATLDDGSRTSWIVACPSSAPQASGAS